jgi:hypothetical protein
VNNSSPLELQIARLLALYLSGEDIQKAKSGFIELLSKPSVSDLASQYLLIAASTFYFNEGDLDEALRCSSKCAWLEGFVMRNVYSSYLLSDLIF